MNCSDIIQIFPSTPNARFSGFWGGRGLWRSHIPRTGQNSAATFC